MLFSVQTSVVLTLAVAVCVAALPMEDGSNNFGFPLYGHPVYETMQNMNPNQVDMENMHPNQATIAQENLHTSMLDWIQRHLGSDGQHVSESLQHMSPNQADMQNMENMHPIEANMQNMENMHPIRANMQNMENMHPIQANVAQENLHTSMLDWIRQHLGNAGAGDVVQPLPPSMADGANVLYGSSSSLAYQRTPATTSSFPRSFPVINMMQAQQPALHFGRTPSHALDSSILLHPNPATIRPTSPTLPSSSTYPLSQYLPFPQAQIENPRWTSKALELLRDTEHLLSETEDESTEEESTEDERITPTTDQLDPNAFRKTRIAATLNNLKKGPEPSLAADQPQGLSDTDDETSIQSIEDPERKAKFAAMLADLEKALRPPQAADQLQGPEHNKGTALREGLEGDPRPAAITERPPVSEEGRSPAVETRQNKATQTDDAAEVIPSQDEGEGPNKRTRSSPKGQPTKYALPKVFHPEPYLDIASFRHARMPREPFGWKQEWIAEVFFANNLNWMKDLELSAGDWKVVRNSATKYSRGLPALRGTWSASGAATLNPGTGESIPHLRVGVHWTHLDNDFDTEQQQQQRKQVPKKKRYFLSIWSLPQELPVRKEHVYPVKKYSSTFYGLANIKPKDMGEVNEHLKTLFQRFGKIDWPRLGRR